MQRSGHAARLSCKMARQVKRHRQVIHQAQLAGRQSSSRPSWPGSQSSGKDSWHGMQAQLARPAVLRQEQLARPAVLRQAQLAGNTSAPEATRRHREGLIVSFAWQHRCGRSWPVEARRGCVARAEIRSNPKARRRPDRVVRLTKSILIMININNNKNNNNNNNNKNKNNKKKKKNKNNNNNNNRK